MRRREFVLGGAGLLGGLRPAFAQEMDIGPRAAVAIGVNYCIGMPKLKGAARDAKRVFEWLRAQNYDSHLFTDEETISDTLDIAAAPLPNTKGVHRLLVFTAIKKIVEAASYEQLVVYFSGHGIRVTGSEILLLTNAMEDSSEAINLVQNVEISRLCGIPNVIFISDACRLYSNNHTINFINGSTIFPLKDIPKNVACDRFFATTAGKPSIEIDANGEVTNFRGIYTDVLLQSFRYPPANLIDDLGDGTKILSKRNLRKHLAVEVRKQVELQSLKINQIPDAILEDVDPPNHFFGNVYDANFAQGPAATAEKEVSTADLVNLELADAGATPVPQNSAITDEMILNRDKISAKHKFELRKIAMDSGYVDTLSAINKLDFDDVIKTASANGRADDFAIAAITGTKIAQFMVEGNISTQIVGGNTLRLTDGPAPGVSCLIRFKDGNGTVVALLAGYMASITVREGYGVLNVSYQPIQDNFSSSRLSSLRGVVAASFEQGAFRFDGNAEERRRKAEDFGDKVRVGKSYDPTLGIYATYAFADAGLADKVGSVDDFMRGDLGVALFDVHLLSRPISESGKFEDSHVLPFCPMLTLGWSYLQTRGINLPESVELARKHLLTAPWTTFDEKGMDILFAAMRKGKLP